MRKGTVILEDFEEEDDGLGHLAKVEPDDLDERSLLEVLQASYILDTDLAVLQRGNKFGFDFIKSLR